MLAALTLLIAGFVARHEIPNLMQQAGESPARPAQADTGNRDPTGAMSDYHPPSRLYAGTSETQPKGMEPQSPPGWSGGSANQPHEHITDSEREQLNKLIQEKAR